MLRRRYQLLLLSIAVLAAFSPAFFADFSKIDDAQLVSYYRTTRGWDLDSIFLHAAGLYYRPLLALSFILDKHILNLQPSLMHFENILFHLANTILVYFLTAALIPADKREKSFVPLTAALLFGLHPVNAESVNWISGRTDLLAGFFIFFTALSLLKLRESGENKYLIFSACSFLFGAFAKESAVAFLPGAFLLMTAERADSAKARWDGLKARNSKFLVLGGFISVLVVLFYYRSSVLNFHSNRIGLTLISISTDWIHSLLVVLRAFGFYLKKLAFPYPLNFAIMEVDPLYEVLAVPLAAFCFFAASRKTLVSAMFTSGMFLIIPSFILAFGQLAWTPYAERYLYLTSAFVIISGSIYASYAIKKLPRVYLTQAISALILLLFVSTLQRSLIWQNDLALCKDTVEKSPLARDIRAVYAGLLADKGDYSEALLQVQQGKSMKSFEYDDRFDRVAAYIFSQQGKQDEAIRVNEEIVLKSKGSSINALQNLISLLEEKKRGCIKRSDKESCETKIMAYSLQLYRLTHDAVLLNKAVIAAQGIDSHEKALKMVQDAARNAGTAK